MRLLSLERVVLITFLVLLLSFSTSYKAWRSTQCQEALVTLLSTAEQNKQSEPLQLGQSLMKRVTLGEILGQGQLELDSCPAWQGLYVHWVSKVVDQKPLILYFRLHNQLYQWTTDPGNHDWRPIILADIQQIVQSSLER